MSNISKLISGYHKLDASSSELDGCNDDIVGVKVLKIIRLSHHITEEMVAEYYHRCIDMLEMKINHAAVLFDPINDDYINYINYISNEISAIVDVQVLPYIFACVDGDGLDEHTKIRFVETYLSRRETFNALYHIAMVENGWWKETEDIIQYICKFGDDDIVIEKTPTNSECLISFETITGDFVECTGPVPHCFDAEVYTKYKAITPNATNVCPYDKTYEINRQRFTIEKKL